MSLLEKQTVTVSGKRRRVSWSVSVRVTPPTMWRVSRGATYAPWSWHSPRRRPARMARV